MVDGPGSPINLAELDEDALAASVAADTASCAVHTLSISAHRVSFVAFQNRLGPLGYGESGIARGVVGVTSARGASVIKGDGEATLVRNALDDAKRESCGVK